MATNLALDDQLIEQARVLGKHRTKKAAVTEALRNTSRDTDNSRFWDYSIPLNTILDTTIKNSAKSHESAGRHLYMVSILTAQKGCK